MGLTGKPIAFFCVATLFPFAFTPGKGAEVQQLGTGKKHWLCGQPVKPEFKFDLLPLDGANNSYHYLTSNNTLPVLLCCMISP